MGVIEAIVALGSISGLGLYLLKELKLSPAERRRRSMEALEKALVKAKEHSKVEDLAKWFGERL